jgi:hypothetical protein
MKSYRFYGDEMEVLGNRLDHARKCAASAKTKWAKGYWQRTVERLLFQWKLLPALHDGDAQVSIIPKWAVEYDFYETQQEGNLYGATDRAYQKLFRDSVDLDRSWHAHREQRLAKAQ